MEEKLYSLMLALTSVSFAALIHSLKDALWWAAGVAVGFACLRCGLDVPAAQSQLALALCCALALCNVVPRVVVVVLAGAIAALCHTQLTAQLQPVLRAISFLLFPLLIAVVLCHRGFRDESMVDEALALTFIGCLCAGIAPEMLDGWASASALQGLDEASNQNTSVASVWLGALWVVSGILYQRWKYR